MDILALWHRPMILNRCDEFQNNVEKTMGFYVIISVLVLRLRCRDAMCTGPLLHSVKVLWGSENSAGGLFSVPTPRERGSKESVFLANLVFLSERIRGLEC
jgi:hypothetical protein